eukprot:4657997-Prorocentrum_lima.AAC.1
MSVALGTLQEGKTLPIGPAEAGSSWYALHRLAYSCLGVHVWSEDGELFYMYMGRCMEKGSLYVISVLWQVLEQQLAGRSKVVLWSDGGVHFKSRTLLGSVG